MSDILDSSDNEKNKNEKLIKGDHHEEMENKGIYQENKSVVLSRKIRIFILILFLLLSIVADLDGGIFSSSIDTVQKDLGMEPVEYGVFTSASYIGRIFGSFFFMIVISFKHRKFTLISTIILHGSAFFVYKFTTNRVILIFIKIFITANKVCASIYRPVWIEQFGLSNYKSSLLISLVIIISSYGNTIGYVLGDDVFGEKDWTNALVAVSALMGLIALGFIASPAKYFYRSYMLYNDKIVDTEDSENPEDNNNNNMIEFSTTKIKKNKGSVFISYHKFQQQKKKKRKFEDLLRYLGEFIKDKVYILCIIKRANTTFVLQIINTYIKSYPMKKFDSFTDDKEKLKDLIKYFYLFSSLACGSLGGLLGGIITKKIGGVENKNSIYILFFSELIVSINIGFLAFSGNFYTYNINLMAFFFFSLIGAPIIQGYLIKTISESKKSVGIGVDMIVSTCLGKIISTIIYGAIEEKYKDLAWKICIGYYYAGTLISFILCYLKIYEEIKARAHDVNPDKEIANNIQLGVGADFNDEFLMDMPVPKKSFSRYVDNIDIKLPNIEST